MSNISLATMRDYLRRSFPSKRQTNGNRTVINRNKVNGVMAEIDFRNYLGGLGYLNRVSAGGWIARSDARGGATFGERTIAIFPQVIEPGVQYLAGRAMPPPSIGLHTICATFHQLGIHSFFCVPTVITQDVADTIQWQAIQLGLPVESQYQPLTNAIQGFAPRGPRYNFLQYDTDLTIFPDQPVPKEFSKENLRIAFQTPFLSEISDIDGLFWGQRHTYPIEIKEKTAGTDNAIGDYFGLDVGPFTKLAFFAAKRGNLHSLFIVREIDHEETRQLVNWWYITFDELAQVASWNFSPGGTPMVGRGGSATVCIPKSAFRVLDAAALASL